MAWSKSRARSTATTGPNSSSCATDESGSSTATSVGRHVPTPVGNAVALREHCASGRGLLDRSVESVVGVGVDHRPDLCRHVGRMTEHDLVWSRPPSRRTNWSYTRSTTITRRRGRALLARRSRTPMSLPPVRPGRDRHRESITERVLAAHLGDDSLDVTLPGRVDRGDVVDVQPDRLRSGEGDRPRHRDVRRAAPRRPRHSPEGTAARRPASPRR